MKEKSYLSALGFFSDVNLNDLGVILQSLNQVRAVEVHQIVDVGLSDLVFNLAVIWV